MFRLFALASCMCLVNLNCQLYLGHDQRNRKTSDSGEMMVSDRDGSLAASEQWQRVLTTGDSFGSISFGSDLFGIATGTDQRFWMTSNGGLTWREQMIGEGALTRRGGAYSLARSKITPSGSFHVLGHLEEVGSAIFTSQDGARTWTATYYTNASLNAIDSIEDQSWVVGTVNSVPVVLHTKGQEKWTEIWRGKTPHYLSSVDFVDVDTGWSVGAKGLILHTMDGGRSWQSQKAPSEANLESVIFADGRIGFVVGQTGTILYTSDFGNTWKRQNSGTQATLTDIVAVSSNDAWAVGRKGTVLHSSDAGQHWYQRSIGTAADINGITIKGGEVWVATSDGAIFRSLNGR